MDATPYVLELENFNWYVPKISGKIPSNRAFHILVLIDKYIVITFGKYNNTYLLKFCL